VGDKTPKAQAKHRNQKRAASAVPRRRDKHVVSSPAVSPDAERPFRFRFDRVDVGGPWCLTDITKQDHAALLESMRQIEGMLVREVIPARCKREDVAGRSPNPDARRRAQDMFPDDHDRIHSLRIGGAQRIWGLQFQNEFSIIWWDPNHDVWPTRRVTDN